jgi:hypothetical protein
MLGPLPKIGVAAPVDRNGLQSKMTIAVSFEKI